MKNFLFTGLFLFATITYGQVIGDNKPAGYKNNVGIRAKSKSSQILLRWAPLSPQLWNLAKQNGFTMTKKTLNTTGTVVSTQSFQIIKKPQVDWIVKKDSSFYDLLYDAIFTGELASSGTELSDQKTQLDQIKTEIITLERNVNTKRIAVGDSNKLGLVYYSPITPITSASLDLYFSSCLGNYFTSFNRLMFHRQFVLNSSLSSELKIEKLRGIKTDSINYISIQNKIFALNKQYTDDDLNFVFSMNSADLNYNAALFSGLGYIDNSVISGSKYRYIIRVNGAGNSTVDTSIPSLDSLEVTASNSTYPNLLSPKLAVNAGSVELKWNFNAFKDNYGSYYLERKEGASGAFIRLNAEPFTKFDSGSDSLYYVDKLPNIKKSYSYRLIGISYFGEFVQSPEVSIEFKKEYSSTPTILKFEPLNSTNYKFDWVFYKNLNVDNSLFPASDSLLKYKLMVSKFSDAGYVTLQDNILKTVNTTTILKSTLKSIVGDTTKPYYLKLIAVSIDNDEIESFPFIKLYFDKTPPAKPSGASAVEYTGTRGQNDDPDNYYVKVEWQPNNEPDLLGYQVFRRFGTEIEKIEISGGIKNRISIYDTLYSKMAYPQIKYFIVALDSGYHVSDTTYINFTKPDRRGPLSPTISSFEINDLNVKLFFQLSPDSDVKDYFLMRLTLDSGLPALQIKSFTKEQPITQFEDIGLENGKTYIYWIYAKDTFGNTSCYKEGDCFQLVPVKILSSKRPPFENFSGNINIISPRIDLTWNYSPPVGEVKYFELFKRKEIRGNVDPNNLFDLFKVLPKDNLIFNDFEVSFKNNYRYGIRAVFTDGTVSNIKVLDFNIPNPDVCNGILTVIKNTIITITSIVKDSSCYEIILDEGFETADNGDYTAEIVEN